MISVNNLTKVYKTKRREVRALNNVSFTLPDTGMIFIVGKSGSGKSTLLNIISGLDSVTSGKIIAGGNNVESMTPNMREKYLGSYIGYVFQDYRLIEDFTVRQNVALAADISDSGNSPDEFIELVGLRGYENRLPKELSGGQKQRVAIARALVKNSKVILADEPTGNLDQETTKGILQLLKKISETTLVVIVSHNLRDADEYADRIIELADGRVIQDKSRIAGYDNNFGIKNGVFHLPHHKDLQKVEIGELLRRGKTSRGIVQAKGGFAPTEDLKYKDENNKLRNKKMSFGNILKVFAVFFKRKLFSKAAMVFMAAVILTVLYIIQALTLYDTSTAIMESLVNANAYGVIVQTSSGSASADKNIGRMTEEKIQRLEDVYSGEMYRLYSEYLYTHPESKSESMVTSAQNTLGFYSRITIGALNTTEKYACKVLGVDELTVLAGTIDPSAEGYRPYGVAITDYTADSIISNFSDSDPDYKIDPLTGAEKSREQLYLDLIGERIFENERTYINAIIDTSYEEELRVAKDMLSQISFETNLENIVSDPVYIDFCAAVNERYNITYSFDAGYYDALVGYLAEVGVAKTSVIISGNGKRIASKSYTFAVSDEYGLKDGEIALGYTVYNSLLDAENKVTTSNLDEKNAELAESPMTITMEQYESTGVKEVVNSEDVKIAKLTKSSSTIYMNSNTFKKLLKFNTYTYSVYLDDPTLARDISDVINECELSICSGMIGNVHFIERCIGIFDKFFGVTMIFILAVCIIFLVNFGIRSIRSNIYEIGVIKAMGGIKKDIRKIFISQSLVLGVGILIVTYIGMQIGALVANEIFLASLSAVTNSNLYGIQAIGFYPNVAIFDICVAMMIVVISAIIANKSIDRLNLISILKAKE